MLSYGVVHRGQSYYWETVNMAQFFLFADTSQAYENWVLWLSDAATGLAFSFCAVVFLAKKIENSGEWIGLNDVYHSNYKVACIVSFQLLYHFLGRLYQPLLPYFPEYEKIVEKYGCRHSITSNLYTLLLPLQLIYLHKKYPPPAPVRVEMVSEDQSEEEIPMIPFERGRSDPILTQWNSTYDDWFERKRCDQMSSKV